MKKLIGIFIVMLLIGTAIPSIGMINENNQINYSYFDDYWNYEFVPGEFIVKFKESPISCASVDNLDDKYQVISRDKIFKNHEDTILDNIYKLKVPLDSDILSIIEDYSSLDNVVYAEPNYIGHTLNVPNDEFFPIQWGLDNTGQTIIGDKAGTIDADIGAVEAWDIETGSPDVVVAIVDSGVDYTHPDLAGNIWINEDELPGNEIDDDGNGFIDDYYGYDSFNLDGDPIDDFGHGTICAGIAAGIGNNEIGIAGVAWNCKIMAVKIFSERGGGPNDKWADGIVYAADNGADVISMSFGHTADYFGLCEIAINYSYSKGCVLVAACGNSDSSKKHFPASFDKVIAVSAVNQNDERCTEEDWDPDDYYEGFSGSNYGYWVDVAAPGNLVYSTMPSYNCYLNEDFNIYTGQNYSMNFDFFSGTSMACPHVAGLAALLLSQDSTLTNEEVKKIIRANTDPYISDYYMGTGRINAFKTLTNYNSQPEIPNTPTGESNGKPNREYSFTTSSTDIDDDDLWYFWDWGDGNYSEWLGPYSSGDICEAAYSWEQNANFSIKVKVKDDKGGESYWSEELLFSTPRNKILNNSLFERLLSKFPILKLLL